MTPKTFESVPLPSVENITSAGRAVIELRGLDQSAPSFEGRLFLNNPSASAETAQSLEQGYAGTIHVYSYGINPIYSAEQTTHGALLPMRREVVATEAILQAAKQGATASVTLVPVVPGAPAARQSAIPGEAVVESVSITAAQP